MILSYGQCSYKFLNDQTGQLPCLLLRIEICDFCVKKVICYFLHNRGEVHLQLSLHSRQQQNIVSRSLFNFCVLDKR